MKINQLFRKMLPDDLCLQVLSTFNMQKLTDKSVFSKEDLEKFQTVEKMKRLSEDLKPFYIPCKYTLYFENLTELGCLTILRQVLRLFKHRLISKQKYVNNKKTVTYRLKPFVSTSSILKVKDFGRSLYF